MTTDPVAPDDLLGEVPVNADDLPEGSEPVVVAVNEAPITAESLQALAEVDRKSKISRTDTQAGFGAGVLILFCFMAAYFHWDLNPYDEGYQSSFPVVVEGAFMVVGTAIAARVMNRR